MQRRQFLASSAAAFLWGKLSWAEQIPLDLRITRIVGFNVVSKRPKLVGKNSRLGVHGDTTTDRMVRLYTNAGVEGIGNCRVDEQSAAKLLNTNPFDFYRPAEMRMAGPLGVGTMPLWDLAGKVLGKPTYELLGAKGRRPVPVYDGSIYFADLLPQYQANWRDRFREEIDMGMETGHRAFKVKIGRGNRWMGRIEGDDRDAEVIELIRAHNPDILIGVDANNGYDLAGAKRFLERTADVKLAFAEEMFDETIDDCLAFKEYIKSLGLDTLLADGETQRTPEDLQPFIDAQAIDVLQGDMNRFGIEGILTEAAWADENMLLVAPHNWGSLVGYYMELHIGRAIPNFYRAEHDTAVNAVLETDGYAIEKGFADAPDAPGFGIAINEERFAAEAKIRFDVKA